MRFVLLALVLIPFLILVQHQSFETTDTNLANVTLGTHVPISIAITNNSRLFVATDIDIKVIDTSTNTILTTIADNTTNNILYYAGKLFVSHNGAINIWNATSYAHITNAATPSNGFMVLDSKSGLIYAPQPGSDLMAVFNATSDAWTGNYVLPHGDAKGTYRGIYNPTNDNVIFGYNSDNTTALYAINGTSANKISLFSPGYQSLLFGLDGLFNIWSTNGDTNLYQHNPDGTAINSFNLGGPTTLYSANANDSLTGSLITFTSGTMWAECFPVTPNTPINDVILYPVGNLLGNSIRVKIYDDSGNCGSPTTLLGEQNTNPPGAVASPTAYPVSATAKTNHVWAAFESAFSMDLKSGTHGLTPGFPKAVISNAHTFGPGPDPFSLSGSSLNVPYMGIITTGVLNVYTHDNTTGILYAINSTDILKMDTNSNLNLASKPGLVDKYHFPGQSINDMIYDPVSDHYFIGFHNSTTNKIMVYQPALEPYIVWTNLTGTTFQPNLDTPPITTITVTPQNTFSDTVHFSADDPNGVFFSPNPKVVSVPTAESVTVSFPGNIDWVSGNGTGVGPECLHATTSFPGMSLVTCPTIDLSNFDTFYIYNNQTSQTIYGGATKVSEIQVRSTPDFIGHNAPVNVTLALPSGITAVLGSNPLSTPYDSAPAWANTTLSLTISPTKPEGVYLVNVTGTSGSIVRHVQLSVNVIPLTAVTSYTISGHGDGSTAHIDNPVIVVNKPHTTHVTELDLYQDNTLLQSYPVPVPYLVNSGIATALPHTFDQAITGPTNLHVKATITNGSGTSVIDSNLVTISPGTKTPLPFKANCLSLAGNCYSFHRSPDFTKLYLVVNETQVPFHINIRMVNSTFTQTVVWHNYTSINGLNATYNVLPDDYAYGAGFGSTQLFAFSSPGNGTGLSGGINYLDSTFGGFLGAPMGVFFLLIVAGLATGKTAPTVMVIMLGVAAMLGALGFFVINQGVWGLCLIAAALCLFAGRKVF